VRHPGVQEDASHNVEAKNLRSDKKLNLASRRRILVAGAAAKREWRNNQRQQAPQLALDSDFLVLIPARGGRPQAAANQPVPVFITR
jgi:hypothetical protein